MNLTMNEYELIVIWKNGERQVFKARNLEDAKRQQNNMLRANGNQIQYCEPRRNYRMEG